MEAGTAVQNVQSAAMVKEGRFDYVRYDDVSAVQQADAKSLMQQVEAFINGLGSGRGQSLALTHLEETYMWIGKAIRDNQVARGVHVEDVPERTNG